MADDVSQIEGQYPIPTYRFIVTVGSETMAFNAVSGLQIEYDTIEYKDGAGGVFRMPGQKRPLSVSLKRGVVKGRGQLYEWINSITYNRVEKRDVSISLTNDGGTDLLVTWNLANVFPTSMSAPNFDAGSNEIAIEELALMGDDVKIVFH